MKNKFLIGAVVLVIASVVVGMFVVGSPMTARKANLDQQKRDQISRIFNYAFTGNEAQTDEELEQRVKEGISKFQNQQTDQVFGYRMEADGFSICSDFYLDHEAESFQRNYWPDKYSKYQVIWEHNAGMACISASKI